MSTTYLTWTPRFAIGAKVRDITVSATRIGTIVKIDPFGYIVEFASGRTVFMGEWQLQPAPHRTRTTEPKGWHVSPSSAGRGDRQGQVCDRSSVAVCSCGWSQHAETRKAARDAAQAHCLESAA